MNSTIKNSIEFQHAEISFNTDDKQHSFDVYHNLKSFGLSIESAFDNWVYRTKKYSVKSFCKYVMSKDVQIVCMDKITWDRLNKK